EMCGKDIDCRRLMLSSALIPPAKDQLSKLTFKSTYFDEFQQRLQAGWPKDGFGHPSSVIPDRDPKLAKAIPGFKPRSNPGVDDRSFLYDESNTDQIDSSAQFGKRLSADPKTKRFDTPLTPQEASLADPKTARPVVGKVPVESAALWADKI